MRIFTSLSFLLLFAPAVNAAIFDVFKDDAGKTKWQHVANFSGSVLIVLLTITLFSLLFSRFKLRVANRELREIKKNLEQTVRKRTENLNKSNRLLQESNSLLEGEIEQHKATSKLLLSSQNYLQSILASMPSMLIGLNENLEVTHWNKTAESITGFSEQSVLGQNLWEAYPTVTVSADQVERVLSSKKPEIIKHSQRGQYYFDIAIYPLSAEQVGVVIVIENVTQRSLAENMLIQRDKVASMGEFASTMAHDINTPLQGILSDVEGVLRQLKGAEGVSEGAFELLQDALGRGKQASAVVNNLLEFSGSEGSDKQEADLAEILNHCIELAENVISDPTGIRFRDVHLERRYAENLPKLQCYTAELQQVFLSLLRQACHSLAGIENIEQAKIELDIYEEFDVLWLKVHHNGRALSVTEQQEIFEPFIQHTTPVNPKPVIVQNRLSFSYFVVTEHHNGEMAVTSDEHAGTTFHLQFQL